jgi:hypothetical protein
MHILSKVFLLSILLLMMAGMPACKTKKQLEGNEAADEELSERCRMKHDPGPCRGAFTRYYYDQKEGRCMEFIYGGCEGAVPFETLEECKTACEGR